MLNQVVTQHMVKLGLNKCCGNCFLIGAIKNK